MTIRGIGQELWQASRAAAVGGMLLGVAIAVETARSNGFHAFGDVVRLTGGLALVFGALSAGLGLVVGSARAARRSRPSVTPDIAPTTGEIAFAATAAVIAGVWAARWFEFTWSYPHRWAFVDGFVAMLAVAIAFLVVLTAAAIAAGIGMTRLAVRARRLGITPLGALGAAVVVALGAALLLAARQGPSPTDPPTAPAAALPAVEPNARRVLLVGCDGAESRVLDTLLAEGALPVLQGLIDAGVRAPLHTIPDHPSPALWTSIASSRAPRATGIADFYVQHVLGATAPVEAFPRHFGLNSGLLLRDVLGRRAVRVTPVSSPMVRARRLWEILAGAGVRVGVVNWLVTWPARAGNAEFVVSDRTWAALSSGETTDNAAALFDPPDVADLVQDAANASTEDAFVAELARRLMRDVAPQVTIAYFRDVDAAEHLAWDAWEPRFFRGRADDTAGGGPVRDAYVAFDRHLGRLVDAAGPEATVVVVSDHGHDPWFTWFGRGTPGGHTYAPPGIFVAAGPGIRPGPLAQAPSVYDITPTVLQLVGIPAAANMEGRVLREILATDEALPRVATWEVGGSPLDLPIGVEDEAVLERLRSLGYLR